MKTNLAYNRCMHIDIDLIQVGQWTEQLYQSDIAEQEIERARLYGLYDDVHVRTLSRRPDQFEILGSPRTWLIAQLIQQPSVPVKQMDHLNESDLSGYYAPAAILSEHYIDKARALKSLIGERRLSLTAAGRLTGKSRSEVCNLMRILKMDDGIIGRLKNAPRIGFGHAKIMAGLSYEKQLVLFERINNEHLTVQQAESVAKELREGFVSPSPEKPIQKKSADVLRLETLLSEHFGARVEIDEKEGIFGINYHGDLDILQGVLDKIGIHDL
jgi:ParB-like chromosome segregation protein Spo0J